MSEQINLDELIRVSHTRFRAQYGRMPDESDDADVQRVWSLLTAKERKMWTAQDPTPPLDVPPAVHRQVAREAVEQGRRDQVMFDEEGS